MNAAEVLDYKADLMVRLERPPVRQAWIGQLELDQVSASGRRHNEEPTAERKKQCRSNAVAELAALNEGLRDAEAYYVSRDMGSLALYSASQLDDLDRIDRTLIPSRSGIVRFEGGIPYQDVRGRTLRISWLAWAPVLMQSAPGSGAEPEEATLIYLWNDHHIEPDDIVPEMIAQFGDGGYEELRRVFGRWGFIGSETVAEGMRLGPAWVAPGERKTQEILDAGQVPTEHGNAIRLAHAFWLLTQQTVADVSFAPVDKPRRKRAGRMGIPDRVTVIQLRARESKGQADGETQVEWSHRWWNKGHWKWQVCGPNHPLAQELAVGVFRARIWVAPYVKGPADKPLVLTDKVYAVVR